MAVGTSVNTAGNPVALVEAWNGRAWSLERPPTPVGGGSLSGVSCASATACIAVGTSYPQGRLGDSLLLAEHWDGTSWSVQGPPIPAGAYQAWLSGVSCTSETACTAVGGYYDAGAGGLLVEHWDGRRWSIQPIPTLAGGGFLSGVSCTSQADCTAVGTVVERWNGSRWSLQPTPSPSAGPAGPSRLVSVSCTSPTACTAVGFGPTPDGVLVEQWDGIGWSIQPTPPAGPLGATEAELASVSCTSPTACTAVGYRDSNGKLALVERWDGTSWSIRPAPLPPGAANGQLAGVSCMSSTACEAIGSDTPPRGVGVVLAQRWNGTRWSIQPTPDPTVETSNNNLTSVSCPSPTACTAVGGYDVNALLYPSNALDRASDALVERWNGTRWSIQAFERPGGTPTGSLTGVSCVSMGACVAVGAAFPAELAARANGLRWSVQTPPIARGPLTAVSCTSKTACVAVAGGSSPCVTACFGSPPIDSAPLAERWDGARWSVQSIRDPSGNPFIGLAGVSCVSRTACTAVGPIIPGAPLAARWNGRRWSTEQIPHPAGASTLAGVSCLSATACTAVGGHHVGTSMGTTLAERWNGRRWSIQPTPNPAGVTSAALNGVSCVSPTACIAVGVSCASPMACIGLGVYGHQASPGRALVERWNGHRWSIQLIPTPSGATNSNLTAVTCKSATACIAVGSYTNRAGRQLTLIERWIGTS